MKDLFAKLSSRKLGVAAVAGVTAATGMVELTWPIAAVACAYIISQAFVDAHGA
jgi:hypothetical protein|tara:strand:+ start:506 stop:667 length:162 start_codon:yes stop_codon:yes gene_type:complete